MVTAHLDVRGPAVSAAGEASRRWNLVWAASGLLFVALFGAGFLVATFVASPSYPSAFASSATVERFVAPNGAELRLLSFLYGLAAVALLVFSAAIAAFIRRAAGEVSTLPWLALGGGMLAATFLLLSALLLWTLGRAETEEDLPLLLALHDLAYLTGGPGHVLAFAAFIGASSAAALRLRALPRWLAWVGIATAAASLLTVTALLWEPAAFLLPFARTLTYLWIAVVSLLFARTAA
jgi:hypothetical protein